VLEREHVRRSLPSRWDAVSQLYRPLAAAGWSIWHRFSFIPTSTAEKAPTSGAFAVLQIGEVGQRVRFSPSSLRTPRRHGRRQPRSEGERLKNYTA